jgi:potassium-dependent mechanosensitive channel
MRNVHYRFDRRGPFFLAFVLGLSIPVGWLLTPTIARCQSLRVADRPRGAGLEQKRAAISAEIARESNADAAGEPGHADAPDEDRLTQLRAIDALYAQSKVRLQERQQLEAEKKEVDRAIESLDKFEPDEPKPYSFLLWDGLKDALATEQQRDKALAADSKTAEKSLAAAHSSLNQAESERRTHHQAKEMPATDGNAPPADLTIERGRAQVALRESEIEVYALRTAICQAKQKELAKKIEVVGRDVVFSAADRDKQVGLLGQAEARLKGQRVDLERKLQQLDEKQRTAEQKLDAEKASPAAKEAATEIWRAVGDAYQAQVVVLDERLDWLSRLRRVWRRRYEVASGKPAVEQLRQWSSELSEFQEELTDNVRSLENRHAAAQTDFAAVKDPATGARLAIPAGADESIFKEWNEFREARLHELADLCAASILENQATQRVVDRFDEELKAKLPTNDAVWGSLNSLRWLTGYKVVGDDKHTVTFGTLAVLLLYLIAGTVLAWALSRLFHSLVLRHFHLHRGKANAINSILFYALCVVFGTLAFRILDIPLAAFAFLGGAIAIAVGFGSQDIMNNFMSGLILLAEQPIRVGDVIELGSVEGAVVHIGMRSTRLRTQANHELIVPNKSMLDEQVTNFTLSDNVVRRSVTMTVERSVPIKQAKKKMLKVVRSHPLVLKTPRPMVLIKEIDNYYGTTAFEVYFALHLKSFMECAAVQSQILERIGTLFPPTTSDAQTSKEPSNRPDDDELDAGSISAATVSNVTKDQMLIKELRKIQARMRAS